MNYTLVIIDMQEIFTASANVKNEVAKAIRQAIADEAPIVFLEFNGFAPTLKELVSITDGYQKVNFVKKNMPSGGPEVKAILEAFRLPSDNLKVCGVNTDQCVMSTVLSLAELLPAAKIHVLNEACSTLFDHTFGIRTMQACSQVNIV